MTPHVEDVEGALFSGHSLRRSGTIHWVSANMCHDTIRRLARWRTNVLEEHLGQYPLRKLGSWSIGPSLEDAHVPKLEVERCLSELRWLVENFLAEARLVCQLSSDHQQKPILDIAVMACPENDHDGDKRRRPD